jgi:hypothetical protein
MAHLAADRLRQVSFAADVFDQNDFAGADFTRFAVAGCQFDTGVEVNDVLR